MAKTASPLPAPLAHAARRFAAWRRTRTTRRIPEELWSLAAELGARYGVSRTARALRVQYYDLKKRISEEPSGAPTDEGPAPAFVEILTAPASVPSECVVEFEIPSGAKMRIEVKGGDAPDLAALSRVFFEPRP
jgi:hypothetical protein